MREDRLEIGGGNVPLDPLRYLNLDIRRLDSVDIQCHACHLPLREECIKEVRSEHLIEHLTFEEARHLINECYRVMEPKALLNISTPDFPKLFKLYEKYGLTTKIFFKGELNDTFNSVLDFFFSDLCEAGLCHKSIWDFNSLCSILQDLGFGNIKRVNEDAPDRFGRTFNLEIVCTKGEVRNE